MLFTILCMLFGARVGAESVSLLKDLDVTNGFMIQYDKDTLFYTVELERAKACRRFLPYPKART